MRTEDMQRSCFDTIYYPGPPFAALEAFRAWLADAWYEVVESFRRGGGRARWAWAILVTSSLYRSSQEAYGGLIRYCWERAKERAPVTGTLVWIPS